MIHRWKDIKENAKLRRKRVTNLIWKAWVAVVGTIVEARYWFRTHTWNRYHIINLKGMDGYKYGWIDTATKMELACWKLLVEFVEEENPEVGLKKTIEEYWPDHKWQKGEKKASQGQVDRDLEIRFLYDWWTKTYPKRKAKLEELLSKFSKDRDNKAVLKNWIKADTAFEKEHTQMLCRLMKIRKSLWT